MRTDTPQTVYRKDYTAPTYQVDTVELGFDLDPARTIVANRMTMRRNPDSSRRGIELYGEDIELVAIRLNGKTLDKGAYTIDGTVLRILDAPDTVTLEIETICVPESNTTLSGLYVSNGNFYTQCEAEGFRRITYFPDRPDVMAKYMVMLRADKVKFPVLLSNGNLVEEGDLPDGRHYAKWEDPFKKPSYLFALVAARLVCQEETFPLKDGRQALLQVWVEEGNLDKTDYAMQSLKRSIRWDEERWDLELDLDRFMIVAVGDFNMGAMENKGLNIFNTKFVLANPRVATDIDFQGIEAVVGHEYFHNWTGNRVTCRDWFQLSLKEGLTVFRDQEFSMDMAGTPSARAVKRILDVRQLRTLQFAEDAGPMAHPVRPDQYVEINNFYTATVYEKGAEVVRMMQTLVGRDGFARGITLYFERHDGQAVTCDDFAQAIADANPASAPAQHLEQFKRWYAQAGTPKVVARGRYDAPTRTYTLGLEQALAPSPGQPSKLPYVIPVAMGLVARDDGRALPLRLEGEAAPQGSERVLVLEEAKSFFTFIDVETEPVPSLLRGLSAPVCLVDALSEAELLVLLAHDVDPFNRWEAGQRLMLNRLLAAIGDGGEAPLDAAAMEALRSVLRHPQLDAAFKELVLTVPSENYIAEQLEAVDPQRVHAARQAMLLQLAHELRDDWASTFETHQVTGGYSPDPLPAGRRALANLALAMLCLDAVQRGDAVWPGRAYQRVKDAANMTERLGALTALVESHAELAEPALERFHTMFAGEALVIDKWFALQARAPERGGRVFAKVKQLLKLPDFSLKNPNRARSLLMPLTIYNPAAFHRSDAAGYVFWADRVLEIDAMNPQLASRLARVMDRWSHLAEPYRSAAREAIARVAAKSELSNDVREVVTRALAD
jgi:aminopeptidase N